MSYSIMFLHSRFQGDLRINEGADVSRVCTINLPNIQIITSIHTIVVNGSSVKNSDFVASLICECVFIILVCNTSDNPHDGDVNT